MSTKEEKKLNIAITANDMNKYATADAILRTMDEVFVNKFYRCDVMMLDHNIIKMEVDNFYSTEGYLIPGHSVQIDITETENSVKVSAVYDIGVDGHNDRFVLILTYNMSKGVDKKIKFFTSNVFDPAEIGKILRARYNK